MMSMKHKKLPMVDDLDNKYCQEDQAAVQSEDAANTNWVTGRVETAVGPVYRVSTKLDQKDLLGSFKARCGLDRMNYTIPPGLYAIGDPHSSSPILVSANYKLSFDYLRRELTGLNLWILVLDTNGINVWCAAGKGSFGTAEIVRMVSVTRLSEIVSHRTLILPQLAAPGVAAHKVRSQSRFNVVYGPIRAEDIPAFLKNANKAAPEMRHPYFTLRDRLILTPVELTAMAKPIIILAMLFFLLNLASSLVGSNQLLLPSLIDQTFFDLAPYLAAMFVGIIMVPALLPYIPGRSFAWKGWLLGILWAFIYTFLITSQQGWLAPAAYFLTIPAITAFLGLNFTGSTTYTSLSGVVKEMGIALPLIIGSAGLGVIALIAKYFI